MSRCQGKKAESLFFSACFFFLIAFSFGYAWAYIVGVGTTPVSATPTHMLRICVNSHDDPLLSRGEHCSPAKKHKGTFLLSDFSVKKSPKSHQRERSPLFENSSRVHELVARAMRGKCVRQRAKRKSVVLHSP